MSVPITATPIIIDAVEKSRQPSTEINPFIFPVGSDVWMALVGNADSKNHDFKSNSAASLITEQDPTGAGVVQAHNGQAISSINGSRLTTAFWSQATGHLALVDMDTGTGFYGAVSPDSGIAGSAAFSRGAGVYFKTSNSTYYHVYADLNDSQIKYMTLTAGVWSGPTIITAASTGTGQGIVRVVFDSSERAHIFYNLLGSLTYVQLDATDTPGSPITIGTGSLFQRCDVLIDSNTLHVLWIKGDQSEVLYSSGTPLSGPTFAIETVIATPTPPEIVSYPALALDGSAVLTAFWVSIDNSFNPGIDEILLSQFTGTWSAPALFYDAISNPPPNDPGYPTQFLHTGQVYWVSGDWFYVTAMEDNLGFCVGYILRNGSVALSLDCPAGGTTATVGVFYDEFLQVTGGTPPYFFEIIP